MSKTSQSIAITLFFALVVLVTASTPLRGQEQPSRPNVVVFLADDLGWGDLGCYGHPRIKTPNLDTFATEGVRFTQCYSACGVCSPSRSAILTGRTPYRNGVWRWIPADSPVHLRTSEITLAEVLKEKGYETCHVGKWHLNGHFNSPMHPQPNDHGFDHWLGTQNNAAPSHKNPTNFVRNGKEVGPLEGYSALLIVEEAVGWLSKQRDPKKPFYLNVWTHEPHLPIESAPEFMKQYADLEVGFRQHHGNVTQMDHAFGTLMKALDKMNLRENTIVFFTADNGPEGTGEGDPKTPGSMRDRTRGSTGGLRGRKRADYEGGIRVPGIIRWPGRIKPGTTSDTPVIGSDIFSTVSAIVGTPLPKDRTIDGTSLLPLFEGKPIKRTQPLYWRTHIAPPSCRVALRIDDWKIVANEDLTKFELYNLEQDWKEQTDLSAKNPKKFEEMKAALIEMDKQVKAEGPRLVEERVAEVNHVSPSPCSGNRVVDLRGECGCRRFAGRGCGYSQEGRLVGDRHNNDRQAGRGDPLVDLERQGVHRQFRPWPTTPVRRQLRLRFGRAVLGRVLQPHRGGLAGRRDRRAIVQPAVAHPRGGFGTGDRHPDGLLARPR
jgi:arylsulfatase A